MPASLAATARAPRAPAQLLVWCFIASEGTFFLLLILAFVALPVPAGQGPSPRTALDPLQTGLYSLLLFASSGTLALGERGRGRRRALGLLVTAALGVAFLCFQALEWRRLLAGGLTVQRNVFGTTFFTLTGFHGAHVAIGVLLLLVLAGLDAAGALRGERGAVGGAALYWHFVDAVWAVIYAVVYLGAAR